MSAYIHVATPVSSTPSKPFTTHQVSMAPSTPLYLSSDTNTVSIRDRLNFFYLSTGGRAFHILTLVLTMLLLGFSLATPSSTQQPWYHVLEGVVTAMFVLEISIRIVATRAAFWSSKLNVVEAALCAFCVLVFLLADTNLFSSKAAATAASSSSASASSKSVATTISTLNKEEHQLLLVLRYVSQMIRLASFVHHSRAHNAKKVKLEPFAIGSGSGGGAAESPQPRHLASGATSPGPQLASPVGQRIDARDSAFGSTVVNIDRPQTPPRQVQKGGRGKRESSVAAMEKLIAAKTTYV